MTCSPISNQLNGRYTSEFALWPVEKAHLEACSSIATSFSSSLCRISPVNHLNRVQLQYLSVSPIDTSHQLDGGMNSKRASRHNRISYRYWFLADQLWLTSIDRSILERDVVTSDYCYEKNPCLHTLLPMSRRIHTLSLLSEPLWKVWVCDNIFM